MGFEYKIAEKIEKIKIDGMSCSEIANRLGFYSKFEVGEIKKVLDSLEKAGKLKTKGSKYFKVKQAAKIKGVLRGNKRGFAFLAREDGGEDLFVPHKNLHGAQHGDTVYCVIVKGDEAKVVDVLERGVKRIVGTYEKTKNFRGCIEENNGI